MTHQPDHKTLPGGSIDYAHYLRRGRETRSLAAHAALARLGGWIAGAARAALRRRPAAQQRPDRSGAAMPAE